MIRPALAVLLVCTSCGGQDREAAAAALKEQAQKRAAVIEEYRPAVTARVEQVRELIAAIDSAPAPSARPPALDPPLALFELDLDSDASNADAMLESDLARLNRGIVGSCSHWLAKTESDQPASFYADVFERCLRARYFLVIRPQALDKPRLSKTQGQYSGGSMVADVVAYDLPKTGPAKPLGTVQIQVELTRSIEVDARRDRSITEYTLNEELRADVLRAIDAAFNAA